MMSRPLRNQERTESRTFQRLFLKYFKLAFQTLFKCYTADRCRLTPTCRERPASSPRDCKKISTGAIELATCEWRSFRSSPCPEEKNVSHLKQLQRDNRSPLPFGSVRKAESLFESFRERYRKTYVVEATKENSCDVRHGRPSENQGPPHRGLGRLYE